MGTVVCNAVCHSGAPILLRLLAAAQSLSAPIDRAPDGFSALIMNRKYSATVFATSALSLRRVCQGTRETLMVLRHAFRLVDQRDPVHVEPTHATST